MMLTAYNIGNIFWSRKMEKEGKNPHVKMQPETGINPYMGIQPEVGRNPYMGIQPEMGRNPYMGIPSGMGMYPNMGAYPQYLPFAVGQPPYGNAVYGNTGYGSAVYGRDYPEIYLDEMENERDMAKLKEMYPEMARDILELVEEECDKMEYDGSLMFDDYPDRMMIGRLKNRIYEKVKDRYPVEEQEDKDEEMVMQQEARRRYPPKKNWLGDMIEVLLYQEMYRRRCRRRNCNRSGRYAHSLRIP